jgi:hypothetical protein
MRIDLSFENFAAVLTVLGTSAAIACGGGTPQPVQANEVVPAAATPRPEAVTSAAASATAPPAPGAAEASLPTPPASPTLVSATSASAPSAAANGIGPNPAAAEAAKPAPKVGTKTAAPKPDTAGEASCGAGTCSGDTKKKIL